MAFRQARLFEGTEPGAHGRPPVPAEETEPLLAYLNGAPIVLAARGFDRDVIDPAGPSNVPMTFHTDGDWVWPGAVGYYLRVHGIPPEPDLVAHIRARRFQVPEVAEQAMDAAVSVITGAPLPPAPSPPSAPSAPAAPSGTAGTPGAPGAGGDVPPGAGADRGGPIEPLAGEPPLSLYRDLRETTLPPGTEVDRLGGPEGNVVYAVGTDWGARSLPPDWANRPRHVYRVLRPVRALTGVAIPWFGQPGGGVAYVLPASVGALLGDGTLAET
ncbi:MAG TPA: TNT domain-containing protein [Thermomonospora sp.]|nr:TNT domain-containing protein [Thermomonospora sp.]